MSSLSSQFSHMSETMSSPSDWTHFYQHNHPSGGHDNASTTMFGGRASSDATVVTSSAASHGSGSISPTGSHLSPEGRVGKPIRRRSRASRRTPTTLLNTDTTNFRAMVQQFTGYPSPHFGAGSHPGGATNFNFGLGSGSQQTVNPRAVMAASASGYQLQFQQQFQQQQYQQQHQDYMLSLSNSRPNMDVSDHHGFVMQAISAHVPPRSSSSSGNTQSNNYMF